MSTRQLLLDSAERMFTDHSDKRLLDEAEAGEFPESLLKLVRDNGLHEIALPDSGVGLDDVFAVLEVAGRFALPLPIAEMVLGGRWLRDGSEFVSVGVAASGGASQVPWGRRADRVIAVTIDGPMRVFKPTGVAAGVNLAGEARDLVLSEDSTTLDVEEPAYALLALARLSLMSGGLRRVLELSLQYAGEREQFGRSISKFQVIQHYLAQMAAEVAAAGRSAQAAASAAAGDLTDERFLLEVAAAKSRVGEAVGYVVETAHQVHGAMGYTYEHQLHHFTRRLWAWRDEYGGERFWQELLGGHLAARGADRLWDFLATRR